MVAPGRKAGGKGDGVFLADAHVGEAFGEAEVKFLKTGAVGHGRSDGEESRIFFRERAEGAAERLAESRAGRLPAVRLGRHADFVGHGGGNAVKMRRIVFRGAVALALARADVQKHGHVELLGGFEMAFQLGDVVTVDGAYVVELKGLEEHARREERLEADLALADDVHDGVALGQAGEHFGHVLLDVHDRAVGEVAAEKAGKRARVLGNGHLVVVENDDEAMAHASGLIQGFKGHAAGERAVADDGDHVFLAAAQIARRGHAEGRGNGRGGVAHAEVVVGAFRTVGKAGKAAVAAQSVEAVGAAGENFPGVALMGRRPTRWDRGRHQSRRAGQW